MAGNFSQLLICNWKTFTCAISMTFCEVSMQPPNFSMSEALQWLLSVYTENVQLERGLHTEGNCPVVAVASGKSDVL